MKSKAGEKSAAANEKSKKDDDKTKDDKKKDDKKDDDKKKDDKKKDKKNDKKKKKKSRKVDSDDPTATESLSYSQLIDPWKRPRHLWNKKKRRPTKQRIAWDKKYKGISIPDRVFPGLTKPLRLLTGEEKHEYVMKRELRLLQQR